MLVSVFLSSLALISAQELIQDVPDGMTADQIREVILDEINKLRAAVHHGPPSNMNYVYWSTEIEKKTMDYANKCPSGHGGYIGTGGQNMCSFSWPPTEDKLRGCIYAFWKECISPGYDYWQAKPVTGKWADTGHYTIQDNDILLKAACGFVNCQDRDSVFVCNYDTMPGSSRLGDFVEKKYLFPNGTSRLYEIGSPCTGCRSGTGWCYKGLCVDSCPDGSSKTDCVCGLLNHCVHGTVDPETCTCQCDNDHTGHLCDRPCQNFGSGCDANACNDAVKARTECAAYCKKCQCSDHGKCVNGAFDPSSEVCGCVCSGGWTGKLCDVCTKEECLNGGTWNDKTCSCDCQDPYRGKTCKLDCSVGDPNVWPCTNLEESGAYVCSNGWYRDQCHARCYPECSALYLKKCSTLKTIPVCSHGTFNPDTCKCECNKGWKGDLCDKVTCDVGDPNVWPCSTLEESGSYTCSNGWYRDQCHARCYSECTALYLNKCTTLKTIPVCSHGTFNPDTCKCECNKGWKGDLCDEVNCDESLKPNEWPCSSWDRTGNDPVYKCGNGWFSGKCFYNCNSVCKAKYLENCPGVDEIPECADGKTFSPTACKCE